MELKLQVGDKVWVSIPANGVITKVGKNGYSIHVKAEGVYEHFGDEEVEKLDDKSN